MSPAAQTSPQWISVRGWRKFQHYDPSKRQPPWIKVYTDLLDKSEYRKLTGRHRALLHDVWMLYARTRCELPASASYIAQACGYPTEWEARQWRVGGESVVSEWRVSGEGPGESVVRKRDLDRLCRAGFITYVASAALAEGHHSASPEVETEKELSVLETQTVSSTAELVVSKRNGHAPTAPAEPTAQTLTAEYVDACHATGIQTPRRLIGQIAQATSQLLTEGVDPDRIRDGYRRMINRGIVQPSLLPNFVAEASIPTHVRAPANGGMTSAEIRDATKGLQ